MRSFEILPETGEAPAVRSFEVLPETGEAPKCVQIHQFYLFVHILKQAALISTL